MAPFTPSADPSIRYIGRDEFNIISVVNGSLLSLVGAGTIHKMSKEARIV